MKIIAALSITALALGALALGAGASAGADPRCRSVHSRVELTASSDPGCTSPIGLCASGVLRGNLRGTSEFIGTSFLPTVDTGTTAVVVLTGDNIIHTRDGELYTKDAIVLATSGAGEFGEVDTVVGGTGVWANASGKLVGTGTFADGVGEALLVGEVCWNE